MKRSALLLPALALGLSLIATGCGGSDSGGASSSDSSSDAPAAITHDDFVTQADAICADGDATINAAADALGAAPTDDQVTAFITDTVVPNTQEQHDAIAALGVPDGDEADVDAMLTALQDGIDALTADPSLTADATPFADANTAAKALGLTACGSSS